MSYFQVKGEHHNKISIALYTKFCTSHFQGKSESELALTFRRLMSTIADVPHH